MRRESYAAYVIFLLLAGALAAGCASTSKMTMPGPGTQFVIPNTPMGDAYGTLMVASQGEVYSGEMYIDILDQTVPMEEVAFTDSTFTFKATLDADGQRMGTATHLTLHGDTMSGTVEVEGIGELEITATRRMTAGGP